MKRKTLGDEIAKLEAAIMERDGRIYKLEEEVIDKTVKNSELRNQIAAARKQGLAEAAKMIMEALTEGKKGE